jgi:hypothetical protein
MSTTRFGFIGGVILAFALETTLLAQTEVGSEFDYQGQLKQDGLPLNDSIDLEFSLHADPTTPDQIGTNIRVDNVPVVKGLFNVSLNFGVEAFAGSARWLEVRVRIPHDPADAAPSVLLFRSRRSARRDR